ncbi:MAG TPA: hypothetical protein VFA32_00255 [Dehalococcoidia bacterium]|jgi:hypothetical protein|nr:hypothetical protein [Dehalococcoidia bacterium]
MVEFSFLEGDPFADRVRNAWERGFLNALSVRFLPMKFQGNRVIESELLEISIVS